MTTQLQDPTHLEDPRHAQEYADAITRVESDRQMVIVRRNGTAVAVIVPLKYLEMLQDAVARERALEIARGLDFDRLVKEHPPAQSWFDGDEPKPF